MDLRVANHAPTGVLLGRRRPVRLRQQTIDGRHVTVGEIRTAVEGLAMVSAVTVLTQHRRPRFQERPDIRAVWRMAVGAVVDRRGVLPKEGPAFFGMAGIAGLVDRVLDQQRRPGRSMRVVTLGASDLAGEDRVGRDAVNLRPLRLVAGKADLGLGELVEHPLSGSVNVMAVAAGNAARLMLAAGPICPRENAGLVATEAGGVALVRRRQAL